MSDDDANQAAGQAGRVPFGSADPPFGQADPSVGQADPSAGQQVGSGPGTDGPETDEPLQSEPATAAPPMARPITRKSARSVRNVVYLVPAGVDAADSDDPADAAAGAHQPTGSAPEVPTPPEWAADAAVQGVDVDVDDDDGSDRADWAWVEEWRSGAEPTPWATGLVLTAFCALVVGVAIWVLCAGLADRPVIAVLVNLLVAAGLAPAMWLSRGLPVLRWIAAGAALGVVGGWVAAVLMLPLPTP